MEPSRHLVISGAAGAAAAALAGLPFPAAVLWTAVAAAAGVLVDVDHVLLPMVVTGAWRPGVRWFFRPARAFVEPRALLDELEYPEMVFHRLATHTAAFLVLVLLARIEPLMAAAAVGVAAHIAADVAWDLSRGTYRDRLRS